MPRMRNGKRDYSYDKQYEASPKQVANRVARNSARKEMADAGKVHKGDGKDVDHAKPLSTGGKTTRSNLRVVSQGRNRSFARNADSSIKSQTSKRERK